MAPGHTVRHEPEPGKPAQQERQEQLELVEEPTGAAELTIKAEPAGVRAIRLMNRRRLTILIAICGRPQREIGSQERSRKQQAARGAASRLGREPPGGKGTRPEASISTTRTIARGPQPARCYRSRISCVSLVF
jgi:hypothetical protein